MVPISLRGNRGCRKAERTKAEFRVQEIPVLQL